MWSLINKPQLWRFCNDWSIYNQLYLFWFLLLFFLLLLFAIYHIFILMSTQSVRPADCLAVYLSASHSFDYSFYYNIAGGVDVTHVDLSHIIPVRGGQNHLYHRFIRYSLVQLCTSICVARCYFSYHDDEIIRLYRGNYDFDLEARRRGLLTIYHLFGLFSRGMSKTKRRRRRNKCGRAFVFPN